MKKFFRTFLLMFLFYGLYSCTPSAPYEITSPCVAGDSDNPYNKPLCKSASKYRLYRYLKTLGLLSS